MHCLFISRTLIDDDINLSLMLVYFKCEACMVIVQFMLATVTNRYMLSPYRYTVCGWSVGGQYIVWNLETLNSVYGLGMVHRRAV